MAGYNLALEAALLFEKYDQVNTARANAIADRMDALSANLETLQAFLSRLSIDGKDSEVDYSDDPDMIALIDLVREIGNTQQLGLPQKIVLVEENTYGWSKKSLDALQDRVNNFINRVLTPKMTQLTTEMTQNQHEMNTILEVDSNMLKEQKNLIERINQRIGR